MRVLIVEDDPHFAAILGEVLRSDDYDVEIRDRAESAHVSVEARPPDLAIVDVNLPGRSGIELVKALRRREASNQLPVILMSAVHRAENKLLRQAIDELKITRFLPKPFSVLDLASTVRAVLAEPVEATPHLVTDAPDSFDNDAVQMEPADLRSWDPPARHTRRGDEVTPEAPAAPTPRPDARAGQPTSISRSIPKGKRVDPTGGNVTHFSHEQVQIPGGEAFSVDSVARSAGEPVAEILVMLCEIWARGLSGVLRVRGRSDWALFAAGHPVDPLAKELALQALEQGQASFHPIEHSAVGTSKPITKHLWMAGDSLRDVEAARRATHQPLYLRNATLELKELPLRPETRWLLETHKDGRPLRAHLDKEKVDLVDVLDDLARLAAMGLVTFGSPAAHSIAPRERRKVTPPKITLPQPPVEAPAPAPTAVPTPRPAKPRGPKQPTRQVAAFEALATLKRLRKEVQRLETADAWTVLGIAPTQDQALVDRAARRMIVRYRDIARNPGYSDEVHRLARDVGGQVKRALGAVKSGKAAVKKPKVRRQVAAPESEDDAFQQGMEALANEDYSLAARFFAAARDLRIDNPRNLAYLGWATWHDRGRPKDKRRTDALELLQLADSFDSSMPQPQYFLAYCEARTGAERFARARLARLLQQNPEHVDARRLLKRLKQKAAAESETKQA